MVHNYSKLTHKNVVFQSAYTKSTNGIMTFITDSVNKQSQIY